MSKFLENGGLGLLGMAISDKKDKKNDSEELFDSQTNTNWEKATNLIPGVYDRRVAEDQRQRAAYLQDNIGERPEFEIPQSLLDSQSLARSRYLEGIDAQTKSNFIDSVNRNQSATINASNSRGGGLANIANVARNSNQAYRDLMSMEAQAKSQNAAALYNQNANVAAMEQEAYYQNELNPYLSVRAEINSLFGASFANNAQGYQSTQQFIGDASGAALEAAPEIASLAASDRRLKKDVNKIGESESGINIYTFRYKDDPSDKEYQGVMAQELIGTANEKALESIGTHWAVDYNQIDVDFKTL